MKFKVRLTHTIEFVVDAVNEEQTADFISQVTPEEMKDKLDLCSSTVNEDYEDEIVEEVEETVPADYVIGDCTEEKDKPVVKKSWLEMWVFGDNYSEDSYEAPVVVQEMKYATKDCSLSECVKIYKAYENYHFEDVSEEDKEMTNNLRCVISLCDSDNNIKVKNQKFYRKKKEG